MEEIAKRMASNNGGADTVIDTLYDLLDGFKNEEHIDKSKVRDIISELEEL